MPVEWKEPRKKLNCDSEAVEKAEIRLVQQSAMSSREKKSLTLGVNNLDFALTLISPVNSNRVWINCVTMITMRRIQLGTGSFLTTTNVPHRDVQFNIHYRPEFEQFGNVILNKQETKNGGTIVIQRKPDRKNIQFYFKYR